MAAFQSKAEEETIHKHVADTLQRCIESKKCITYSDLGMQLNMHPRDLRLTLTVERTIQEDIKAKRPIRACMIVRKGTGLPGHAFFEFIQTKKDVGDWRKFWREETANLIEDRSVSVPL